MPLASQYRDAHVIIHKLEQPHRFEYAANCACGWHHHGFVSDSKYNDEYFDMRAAAIGHLAGKHRMPPAQAADSKAGFIEVAPFTTVGGMAHDDLKLRLDAAKAKAAEEAPKVVPGATAPAPMLNQPAKPVQGGGQTVRVGGSS